MSELMYQKTLQDVVKGIRANKKDPSAFISVTIGEIKTELKSPDPRVKAQAIRKLTYLQMIGYDVSWASFSIIEVMSQPRFAHKRIGYLAANQIFSESTDVVLLTVNLFKKEFQNAAISSPHEVGMAINSLANIATADVARDCISDLVNLMNHPSTYLRKKAVLCMYKLYIKYPQGLRLTFEKLKDRLEDTEVSVVSTAVNVICELANKNPKNYLAMAPKFFSLLTSSSNNWMLIKVVKLLGSLVSEEPRLARKLLEPLVTIIQNTGAKSLQYECIHTVCLALPYTRREDGTDAKNVPSTVKVCSEHLRSFVEHEDQNLKYLGLVGLSELLKSHPKAVVDHRDLILKCLNDDDITIRIRSLELLGGIATRKSLPDLCHHLIQHAKRSEGIYRDEIIYNILTMGSKEKFALVNDFAWYMSILLELTSMPGNKRGQEIAYQLIEIALRVDTVRPFAVETMLGLLFNEKLILGQARKTVSEVLKAAAWIVGEYSEIVTNIVRDERVGDPDDDEEDEEEDGYWIEGPNGEEVMSTWRGQDVHVLTVDALLHPRTITLPEDVQSTYIQAAMKMFLRSCADCNDDQLREIFGLLRSRLSLFLLSPCLEVQERASTIKCMLHELGILAATWEEDLNAAREEAEKNKDDDNLLDVVSVQVDSNTRRIDSDAVNMIGRKRPILAAVVAEPFYAVHPKAQRRVPVPEGVDLSVAINPTALDAIMELEGPENPQISKLSFVLPISSTENEVSQRDPFEDARLATIMKSSFQSGYADDEDLDEDMPDGFNAIGGDTQLFYIGKNTSDHAPDINTLSKILGDYEEDVRPRRKKDKGKKKHKKKHNINQHDMVPNTMGESDDDEEEVPKKTKSGRYKKGNVDDEFADLTAVDLTTPLQEDEKLFVRQHREVPDPSYDLGSREKHGKKSKKEKHEKKKGKRDKEKKDVEKKASNAPSPQREKKSKKSSSKGGNGSDLAASLNLLDLDFGGVNTPTPESAPVLIDEAIHDAATDTKNSKKDKKEKHSKEAKSSKKEKKGSEVWMQLYTGRSIDVFYSLGQSGMKKIAFKTSNRGPSNLTISADISFKSLLPLSAVHGTSLRLAHHLASGGENEAVMEVECPDVITGNVQLTAALRIMFEGGGGVETINSNCSLKIPICTLFTPNEMDENAFTTSIAKNSSRWGAASARIVSSLKPKYAMRSIGSFIRGYFVEEENSKAASLTAKSATGAKVFCLLKASKDGASVACDIKVLGASKNESQSIADALGSSLAELAL